MFNYGNVRQECYFFGFFSTQIYLRRVFKMSAFGINVSLNATRQRMRQNCALFNAVPNVIEVKERSQLANYCVIPTVVSRSKRHERPTQKLEVITSTYD